MTKKFYLYTIISFIAGFAIPVSTAFQNITFLFMSLVVIFDKSLRAHIKEISKNYFVIFSVALYVVYLIWSFKSNASKSDVSHMLLKMRGFVLCPLIFAYFRPLNSRIWASYGFLFGSITTLAISFAMFVFKYPMFSAVDSGWSCSIGDWAVFRYHTYHNYFLAVMVIGLLSIILYYRDVLNKKIKYSFYLLILLAAIDILYLVQGRAGQILFVIMLMMVFLLWSIRKGIIACIIISLMSLFVLQTSSAVKCGVDRLQSDVAHYDVGQSNSSIGERLEFHAYTLKLIKEHPILGYGTGSFHYEYQKYTGFSGVRATRHPHNDYYWIWVELGITGVIMLLLILASGLYYAYKLKSVEGKFAIIILLSYAICALQGGAFTDNISSAAFIVIMAILLAPGGLYQFRFNGLN